MVVEAGTLDVDDDRNVVELFADVVEVASVTDEETDGSTHPDWQPLLRRQLFQKVLLARSLFCLFKRPFRLGERAIGGLECLLLKLDCVRKGHSLCLVGAAISFLEQVSLSSCLPTSPSH